MKNIIKILLLLSIFAFGITGCSKEKRIERHLVRKEGRWDVQTYDYKYYYNNTYYANESFSYSNAGNIVFEKNGTYVWTFIADGDTDISAGTWSNTADEITMIENSYALKFKILEESKKEMKLEYTESDGIEKEVYTLTLKKD